MIKKIDIPLQNNSHFASFLEWSVNYFVNHGAGYYLLKIGYKKSNYTKHDRYQCNLLKTFQQQTITNLQSIKTKPKNSNNNND
jgi:hypothetical protein